jgi:hypothetical protein
MHMQSLTHKSQNVEVTKYANGAPIDQLLGMDWSVGITTKSAVAASAANPFVVLQLRVKQAAGTVRTHDLEVSVLQLAAIEASMRDAALAVERA